MAAFSEGDGVAQRGSGHGYDGLTASGAISIASGVMEEVLQEVGPELTASPLSRSSLTQSMRTRLGIYFADLNSMRSLLCSIIETNPNVSDHQLSSLFDLLQGIDSALAEIQRRTGASSSLSSSPSSSSSSSSTSSSSAAMNGAAAVAEIDAIAEFYEGTGAYAEEARPSQSHEGGAQDIAARGLKLDQGEPCDVCWDPDVPVVYTCDDCGESKLCEDCFAGYLKSQFGAINITCPGHACDRLLKDPVIHRALPGRPEEVAEYERSRFLIRLRSEPNCRWCPRAGCGAGNIGIEEEPMITCSQCDLRYCFHCSLEWHPDMTCKKKRKEHRRHMTKEEKRQEKWLRKGARECPGCGCVVQKSSGCNHMRCRCGTQFCWSCGGEITNENDSEYPQHFKEGPCKGKQFDSHESSRLVTAVSYGIVGTMVVGGGLVLLAVAVPVGAVALPLYGGYRLLKH